MKKTTSLILSSLTAAFLVGCGGGSSSSTPTTTTTTPSSVTVERGPLLGATVTDANGQVATATTASSNVYTFATTPVYPITATGGVIDVDNNGIDAGDVPFTGTLTSYSEVITPITTLIGDPTSDAGKAMIASLKEKSGITNDDDLLHKVPSATSPEALILTNAIFESFQANFDDDSTNDFDLTDATTLESTFTDLKDKIDAYNTVRNQSLSGEIDLHKIAQALEEENIKNLNKETLDTDTAGYFKNNINSGDNANSVKSTGEITVEPNSVIYVINNTNDYVLNNVGLAKDVKFYPNKTLDCSTLSGYSLDSTYDSTKATSSLPVIGSTTANIYTNTTTKSVCMSQDYSNLPFVGGGNKSAVFVMKVDNLFSSTTDSSTGTTDSSTSSNSSSSTNTTDSTTSTDSIDTASLYIKMNELVNQIATRKLTIIKKSDNSIYSVELYDNKENLIKDQDGKIFTYNDNNKVIGEYTSYDAIIRTYNENSNLLTEKKLYNNKIEYDYTATYSDSGMILTSIDKSTYGDTTLIYSYNSDDNLIKVTTYFDSSISSYTTYSYDTFGNILTESSFSSSSYNQGANETIEYTYDINNNKISKIYTKYKNDIEDSINSTYWSYDSNGEILTEKHNDKYKDLYASEFKENIYLYNYRYDTNGNKINEEYIDSTDSYTKTYEWTYNSDNKILTESASSSDAYYLYNYIKTFTYDINGNLIKEFSDNLVYSIDDITIIYTYDENNNLLTKDTGYLFFTWENL